MRSSWLLLPLGALLLLACDSGQSPAAARTDPPAVAPPPPAPQSGPASQSAPIASAPAPLASKQEIPADVPRVYALTRNVWIRSAPESGVQWIGSLWLGGSVKIRGPERVPGAGCGNAWVPIEPRGWVCVDDRRATVDPKHPALRRLFADRARTDTAWPHNYAVVPRDVSRYRLPPEVTPGAPRAAEIAAQLPFPLLGSGTPDLPPGLYEGRTKMVARSALAYVRQLTLGERDYLLLPDFSFVRKDQIEPVKPSQFVGALLEGELTLPLAFVVATDARRYRLEAGAAMQAEGEALARLSTLPLSGETREIDGETYYQLRGQDRWLKKSDLVIPQPRAPFPFSEGALPGRATWLEGSILGGWLVAYEGKTPVYATLISAGRGGTPVAGQDPVSTASTPTGRFFITGKFATATMESSTTPIVHGDVPWTQNFSGPHAIHSAYWHDEWGDLKSAGCVNVSPQDGKWLFGFTEPAVPDGWHAVKHISRDGPATLLILHE